MSNGPTDFIYVTPTQFLERMERDGRPHDETYKDLLIRANAPDVPCEVCETLNAWKFAGTGMCFPCTTGESDASDDFELLPE